VLKIDARCLDGCGLYHLHVFALHCSMYTNSYVNLQQTAPEIIIIIIIFIQEIVHEVQMIYIYSKTRHMNLKKILK